MKRCSKKTEVRRVVRDTVLVAHVVRVAWDREVRDMENTGRTGDVWDTGCGGDTRDVKEARDLGSLTVSSFLRPGS